jgi:hypothetical protein
MGLLRQRGRRYETGGQRQRKPKLAHVHGAIPSDSSQSRSNQDSTAHLRSMRFVPMGYALARHCPQKAEGRR